MVAALVPPTPDTEWREMPGRTVLRSVRLCETGRLWRAWAPPGASAASDVTVQAVRCWSPSCRRCGPLVGAQDFRRIAPAVESRREWLYLVLTAGPKQLARLRTEAEARRSDAFRAWHDTVEGLIGPAPDPLAATRRPWDWWDRRSWADCAAIATAWEHWRRLGRSIVPWPTGRELSTNPYNLLRRAFTLRYLKRLRRAFPGLLYVQSWEAHRDGRPHLNLLLGGPAVSKAIARHKTTAEVVEFEGRERAAIACPGLRKKLRAAATACGFGAIFWLEVARPKSAALAGYLSKLARETCRPEAKGQTPYNRPRNFRRFDASRDLLEPRHFPRGIDTLCPCADCDSPSPPLGWCSRTIGHHLRTVHEWSRAEAAAIVRAAESERVVGTAVTFESSPMLDPADLRRAVVSMARRVPDPARFHAIAELAAAEAFQLPPELG